jgi:hypothetical protein
MVPIFSPGTGKRSLALFGSVHAGCVEGAHLECALLAAGNDCHIGLVTPVITRYMRVTRQTNPSLLRPPVISLHRTRRMQKSDLAAGCERSSHIVRAAEVTFARGVDAYHTRSRNVRGGRPRT